jgi:hypothetical protein
MAFTTSWKGKLGGFNGWSVLSVHIHYPNPSIVTCIVYRCGESGFEWGIPRVGRWWVAKSVIWRRRCGRSSDRKRGSNMGVVRRYGTIGWSVCNRSLGQRSSGIRIPETLVLRCRNGIHGRHHKGTLLVKIGGDGHWGALQKWWWHSQWTNNSLHPFLPQLVLLLLAPFVLEPHSNHSHAQGRLLADLFLQSSTRLPVNAEKRKTGSEFHHRK